MSEEEPTKNRDTEATTTSSTPGTGAAGTRATSLILITTFTTTRGPRRRRSKGSTPSTSGEGAKEEEKVEGGIGLPLLLPPQAPASMAAATKTLASSPARQSPWPPMPP